MKCEKKAYAKINLSLDIVGTRDDGYHLIRSVMQQVSLCDVITVETGGEGIRVTCDAADIPCDENNLVYKAAVAFFNEMELAFPLSIHIEKHIPSQAGLGGGSADAAAVILALNEMTGADLDARLLRKIGLSAGADVPFCLTGGCALCEGIGEVITPLESALSYSLLIVKPDFGFNTGAMYKVYDEGDFADKSCTDAVMQAVKVGDLTALTANLGNIFEDIAADERIEAIKKALLDAGALGACMSGSGSAVYGIFEGEPPLLELDGCAVYAAKAVALV